VQENENNAQAVNTSIATKMAAAQQYFISDIQNVTSFLVNK
jgi:hypothetical protein